jgi:hypothetical protein
MPETSSSINTHYEANQSQPLFKGNEDPMFGSRNPFRKLGDSSTGNDEHPQILLTIRLEKTELDIPVWREWVRNLPVEGKDVKIEGIYRSFSTLLLLRMPVAIWDLLPENQAYSFVGFVTPENLGSTLHEVPETEGKAIEVSHIGIRETASIDSKLAQSSTSIPSTAVPFKLSERSIDYANRLSEEKVKLEKRTHIYRDGLVGT